SNELSIPNIARDILELWWANDEHDTDFSHVTNVLPVIGASSASELVPELLKRSQAESAQTRERAAETLGRLGPAAATEPVLSRLNDCLRDPGWYVRVSAAKALGRLSAAAATEPVLSLLTDWLRDPEVGVRSRAAVALNQFLQGG